MGQEDVSIDQFKGNSHQAQRFWACPTLIFQHEALNNTNIGLESLILIQLAWPKFGSGALPCSAPSNEPLQHFGAYAGPFND